MFKNIMLTLDQLLLLEGFRGLLICGFQHLQMSLIQIKYGVVSAPAHVAPLGECLPVSSLEL